MTLTFEPYDAAGNPRVFAGMFRPPFEEVLRNPYLLFEIGDGHTQVHPHALPEYYRANWLEGRADRPLYKLKT